MSDQFEYYSRANLDADLPTQVPVIILPGCALLPGVKLPLYIFEPRYRAMLADVLMGDRLFCIGTALEEEESGEDGLSPAVHRHSTMGLVRSCVGSEDGTSHLVLLGLTTIRIVEWVDSNEKPYPLAKIIVAEPETYNPGRTSGLTEELMKLLVQMTPPPFMEVDEWEATALT